MINDRFVVFLDSVFEDLLSIVVSMFIREIGLKFSFLVGSLCSLGMRVIVASKNELGSIPSDSIFGNILGSIGVISAINV